MYPTAGWVRKEAIALMVTREPARANERFIFCLLIRAGGARVKTHRSLSQTKLPFLLFEANLSSYSATSFMKGRFGKTCHRPILSKG
jgi:hypothetical protein